MTEAGRDLWHAIHHRVDAAFHGSCTTVALAKYVLDAVARRSDRRRSGIGFPTIRRLTSSASASSLIRLLAQTVGLRRSR
jgi:hypothetical protein